VRAVTRTSFRPSPGTRCVVSPIVYTAMGGPATARPGVEEERSDMRRTWFVVVLAFAGVAGLTLMLLALLTNIFERKQEARQPFVRVAEVTEDTVDPKVWGRNWPNEYDTYVRTSESTGTKYGGRGLAGARPGSSASSLATRSSSTTATGAAMPLRYSTRNAPSASPRSNSPAPACSAMPRTSRSTASSERATYRKDSRRCLACRTARRTI
jgi:hypothetical protein